MKLEGLAALNNKLAKIKQYSEKRVSEIVAVNAKDIERDASQRAPKMFKTKVTGFPANNEIIGNILAHKESKFRWRISVNSKMAAYAEFGTGAYVDVPKGWEDIAWSYYVNGKGLILPTPFFIPAVREGTRQFSRDLKNYIKEIDAQSR